MKNHALEAIISIIRVCDKIAHPRSTAFPNFVLHSRFHTYYLGRTIEVAPTTLQYVRHSPYLDDVHTGIMDYEEGDHSSDLSVSSFISRFWSYLAVFRLMGRMHGFQVWFIKGRNQEVWGSKCTYLLGSKDVVNKDEASEKHSLMHDSGDRCPSLLCVDWWFKLLVGFIEFYRQLQKYILQEIIQIAWNGKNWHLFGVMVCNPYEGLTSPSLVGWLFFFLLCVCSNFLNQPSNWKKLLSVFFISI